MSEPSGIPTKTSLPTTRSGERFASVRQRGVPTSVPLRINPDASLALTSIVRSGRNVIASV